jgi:hypothetical protein
VRDRRGGLAWIEELPHEREKTVIPVAAHLIDVRV